MSGLVRLGGSCSNEVARRFFVVLFDSIILPITAKYSHFWYNNPMFLADEEATLDGSSFRR